MKTTHSQSIIHSEAPRPGILLLGKSYQEEILKLTASFVASIYDSRYAVGLQKHVSLKNDQDMSLMLTKFRSCTVPSGVLCFAECLLRTDL